ncbi:MAG: MBL fold metallo-hydrolase [Halieaceae bacterium]|nr:MBL fold metallo-hydrolase [Halieaceae bacterium]
MYIVIVAFFFSLAWHFTRPTMENVGIAYFDRSPISHDQVTVRWLGITTLLIDDGETQIISDAFFSRPSFIDLLLKRRIQPDPLFISTALSDLEVDRLAVIVPVHSHYDHAMDSAVVAELTGASVLGSFSTANIAKSFNLPTSQIIIADSGKTYQFGKFTVTLIESRHAPLASNMEIDGVVAQPFVLPAPYTAWQQGKAYSIHIAHPQGSILIQGSAGFIPESLNGVDADVVFLGVGGLNSLSNTYRDEYIFEVVKKAEPAIVVPIHHDNLFGAYGEVEQHPLMIELTETSAQDLKRLIHPAVLKQLRFAKPTALFD